MEPQNDSMPVAGGNGESSPSVQIIQNFLQHNQIINESETAQLIRMEEHLRRSNPALADKWVEEALEVSRHKRHIAQDLMEVIKRDQRNELWTDISNAGVSVFALVAILGAVVYAIYMGQPWVAASIFGGAAVIVISLRVGKKSEAPAPPKPAQKKKNRR